MNFSNTFGNKSITGLKFKGYEKKINEKVIQPANHITELHVFKLVLEDYLLRTFSARCMQIFRQFCITPL